MAKDEIARLSKWGLYGAEEKDSRGAERSDNGWRVVVVAKCRRGGHNSFDKEDAAKSAYPSKGPDFVLDRDVAEISEWGEW